MNTLRTREIDPECRLSETFMKRKIYLFDTEEMHLNLLPLSFIRPVAAIRIGITTIKEKWDYYLDADCNYLPVDYLIEKYGSIDNIEEEALFIAGNILPSEEILHLIYNMEKGDVVVEGDRIQVYKGKYKDFMEGNFTKEHHLPTIRKISYVFDIFLQNPEEIRHDFKRITRGRKSEPLPDTNIIIGDVTDKDGYDMIFIEEGARVDCSTINLRKGPVYIGRNSKVMEGSHIRGPLALCENAKIRMGSKIYGGCTFGPYTKIGGEIDNTVIFGYSNKAHDGYMGNAVIGEWCNIGAGVNASNLKNDYAKIKIWNYAKEAFMKTSLQFCGLILGDHSKIGINCMLNTATTIGVGVNLHGTGYPRVYIPNFCEGSPTTGFSYMKLDKFFEIAERVMERREIKMAEEERKIFEKIYSETIEIV